MTASWAYRKLKDGEEVGQGVRCRGGGGRVVVVCWLCRFFVLFCFLFFFCFWLRERGRERERERERETARAR